LNFLGAADYGFEAGILGCNAFCAPDMTRCRNIGFVPFAQTSGMPVEAVFVTGPDQVVLISDYMTATHVDGSVVTRHTLPVYAHALWGTDATDLHAVGQNGNIAHFDGTAWTQTRTGTGTSANLFGAWGSAANDVYAAGYSNYGTEIVRFNGSAWSAVDTFAGQWRDVWGASANNVRAVGASGVIRRYTGTWSNEDASACWTSAPLYLFRSLGNGRLRCVRGRVGRRDLPLQWQHLVAPVDRRE